MSKDRDLTKLLGRHQEHDPRSKQFPAAQAVAIKSVEWQFHGQVLDQGQLGSCTGNAGVDTMMTGPYWDHLKRTFVEADAVALYEVATHIDRVPGSYPPNDTGSSGLAVCRAMKMRGWISAYHHAFGVHHALGALMLAPVMVGIPWYERMFDPDPDGTVHVGGGVAGGHEICCLGYDTGTRKLKFLNSWGTGWGAAGYFFMSDGDFASLLAQGGDVAVPVI
jgi:hypothetical protein